MAGQRGDEGLHEQPVTVPGAMRLERRLLPHPLRDVRTTPGRLDVDAHRARSGGHEHERPGVGDADVDTLDGRSTVRATALGSSPTRA